MKLNAIKTFIALGKYPLKQVKYRKLMTKNTTRRGTDLQMKGSILEKGDSNHSTKFKLNTS